MNEIQSSKSFFDAITCAIVIDPACVSRNRHYALYTDPKARVAHLRAHRLLRLARTLLQLRLAAKNHSAVLQVRQHNGGLLISYTYEHLSLKRTVLLDSLELTLMRYIMSDYRKAGKKIHGQLAQYFKLAEHDVQRINDMLQPLRNHPTVVCPSIEPGDLASDVDIGS